MIKKQRARSCCGNRQNHIWELESPLTKQHLQAFNDAGYITPVHMTRAGMFFVESKGLIASAPFGTTRVQIKCTQRNCTQLLSSLENLLERLTSKRPPSDAELKKKKDKG